MTYKKGNWVKINATGEIGQVTEVWTSVDYTVEVNGIARNEVFSASELSPTPKTWETIEKGDILVNEGAESKVLAVLDGVLLRSLVDAFDIPCGWCIVTELKGYGWTIKGATPEKWTPREGEQVYRITSRGTIVLNPYNDKTKAREAFLGVFPNNLDGREQAEVRLAEIKALK